MFESARWKLKGILVAFFLYFFELAEGEGAQERRGWEERPERAGLIPTEGFDSAWRICLVEMIGSEGYGQGLEGNRKIWD